MIEIGGKPILWHIMKIYSSFGFNEFVILVGYKGYIIKEYFANYFLHQSDITFDLASNEMQIHKSSSENWKVTIVDTGLNTMTGGRIKKAKSYLGEGPFMLTYGDGVADVNINRLIEFHKSANKIITLTAIRPEGRFGALNINDGNEVLSFKEKPQGDGHWINGGFFICEQQLFDYIDDEGTILEREPLQNLANENQINAYKHPGYWQCMDTKRDMDELNRKWDASSAKWKTW